ncbi:substrate-binding domain-containing protein [Aeromicrobium sp. CF3.5]|uniref:substrate-binding domain-containing protein n=1 Tax=Aeromicrobium sp. CF3.5 TaxID=3373078 RepID=UPI003EE5E512
MKANPKRSLRGLTAVMVALLMLAGCGQRVGEEGRIGVVYLNAEGFYAGVKQGIEVAFDESGPAPQLLQTNVRSDPSQESSFIDTVSSAKVDALIVAPTSAEASIPALRLAHESGIPIVCYNTCLTDRATEEYVDAWVLGSPAEFGRISGEQMGEYFVSEGIDQPQVGVLNCEQFEVCIERREGFEAALLEAVPDAEIVANQQGLTVDESVRKADRILTSQPDLDAFYAEAGSATVGAVRAVQSRGQAGEVVVFGGDMSTQVARMLEDGSILKGVADISGIAVGEMAARTAQQLLAGDGPSELIVPAPVDAYLGPDDGSRWLAEHPDGVP